MILNIWCSLISCNTLCIALFFNLKIWCLIEMEKKWQITLILSKWYLPYVKGNTKLKHQIHFINKSENMFLSFPLPDSAEWNEQFESTTSRQHIISAFTACSSEERGLFFLQLTNEILPSFTKNFLEDPSRLSLWFLVF